MAFKANAIDPERLYVYPKEDVIVRVELNGASKSTEVIKDENGEDKTKNKWTLEFRFSVISKTTGRTLFTGAGQLIDFNPEKPVIEQAYECVKKIAILKKPNDSLFAVGDDSILKTIEDSKEDYNGQIYLPMFTEIENV